MAPGEPKVLEVLDFFSGSMNEVALSKGQLFTDTEFPTESSSSLYSSLCRTPRGFLPPGAVCLGRRCIMKPR
jgi:hypothetical protein